MWEIAIEKPNGVSFYDCHTIIGACAFVERLAASLRANTDVEYVERSPLSHIPHVQGESVVMLKTDKITVRVTVV